MPAIDRFSSFTGSVDGPLSSLENVTPSDGSDLSHVTRALYVGTAGTVAVTMIDGQTLTLSLAAGWHPVRVSRILATGTTATNLIAGW